MKSRSVLSSFRRGNGAAAEIVSRCRITQVAHALTGTEPRRTTRDTARMPATWRGGDGLNVCLDDSRGVWHDFVTDEGGGLLDLIVRVRGGSRADALRWLADMAGVPLDDTPVTPEDRERWARERRRVEQDLPAARLWRRAAVVLGEEVLDTLKRGLSPTTATTNGAATAARAATTAMRPEIGELREWTARLARWRRIEGGELVEEYRWWHEHHPQMAAGMVRAMRVREQAEVRALLRYLRVMEREAA